MLRVLTSAKAEPKAHPRRRKPLIHPSAHAHSDGSGTRRSGSAPGRTYCGCTLCVCVCACVCLFAYGRRSGAERGRVRVVVRVGRPQGTAAEHLIDCAAARLGLACRGPVPGHSRGVVPAALGPRDGVPRRIVRAVRAAIASQGAPPDTTGDYIRAHTMIGGCAAPQQCKTTRRATYNVSTCGMLLGCIIHRGMHHTPHHAIAACSKQHANVNHGTFYMQHGTFSTCNTEDDTCNIEHSTCNTELFCVQHGTFYMQHGTGGASQRRRCRMLSIHGAAVVFVALAVLRSAL